MFRLGQPESFWYPVRVEMLDAEGVRRTHEFRARFRRYGRAEFERLLERVRAGETNDLALAREVLLDWKDVRDEDGNELPFGPEARERLLDLWPVLPAVVAAFLEAHSPEGRRKN